MKTAIIVLSDPDGGDESLGRLFNALATAHELKARGEHVEIVFQGAGTRWTGRLVADHPAHALFEAVADRVAGVSHGCASLFGAREDAGQAGLELLSTNPIEGTPGLASIASYSVQGFAVLTF